MRVIYRLFRRFWECGAFYDKDGRPSIVKIAGFIGFVNAQSLIIAAALGYATLHETVLLGSFTTCAGMLAGSMFEKATSNKDPSPPT